MEKCVHFWDLMRRIIGGAHAVRVYASGGQNVNHLNESYDLNGEEKKSDSRRPPT